MRLDRPRSVLCVPLQKTQIRHAMAMNLTSGCSRTIYSNHGWTIQHGRGRLSLGVAVVRELLGGVRACLRVDRCWDILEENVSKEKTGCAGWFPMERYLPIVFVILALSSSALTVLPASEIPSCW